MRVDNERLSRLTESLGDDPRAGLILELARDLRDARAAIRAAADKLVDAHNWEGEKTLFTAVVENAAAARDILTAALNPSPLKGDDR